MEKGRSYEEVSYHGPEGDALPRASGYYEPGIAGAEILPWSAIWNYDWEKGSEWMVSGLRWKDESFEDVGLYQRIF